MTDLLLPAGTSGNHRLVLTTAFYWDLNDGTRTFSKRFAEKMGGRCQP